MDLPKLRWRRPLGRRGSHSAKMVLHKRIENRKDGDFVEIKAADLCDSLPVAPVNRSLYRAVCPRWFCQALFGRCAGDGADLCICADVHSKGRPTAPFICVFVCCCRGVRSIFRNGEALGFGEQPVLFCLVRNGFLCL